MSKKHHAGSPVHDQRRRRCRTYAAPVLELLEPRLMLSALPGDANINGIVDVLDVAAIANNFGSSGATWGQGDFNGDGEVDVLDLAIMANHFGDHLPYQLTVTDGSGSGYYNADDLVTITADTPPGGKIFNMWIGHVGYHDGMTTLSTDYVARSQVDYLYVEGTAIEVGDKFKVTMYDQNHQNPQYETISATSTSMTTTAQQVRDAINNSTQANFTKVTAAYTFISIYDCVSLVADTAGVPFFEDTLTTESDDSPSDGQVFRYSNSVANRTPPANNITKSSPTYIMPACDATIYATYRDSSAPLDWYPRWEYIANQHFGAEQEPLAYDFFGSDLVFQTDGKYEYASETSAFVAWETNLPATTYIEYGTTTSYDSQIDQDARFTYLHQYHVTGLSNNTTYHYRIVATDERGNIITSPDDTFATATPSGTLIRLAGGSRSTAYTLSTDNATYLLEGDLIADGVAFNVTGTNVKLDLGGHTVIYNQVDVDEPLEGELWKWYRNECPVGVRALYRSGVTVRNGTIRQGLGYNHANEGAAGFSPIFFYSSTGELAGLHLEWAGPQVAGIGLLYSAGTVVHHNTLLDRGGDITNRHQGTRAIGGANSIHHNLILRARHRGIDGTSSANYYDNEIYIDSVCTNAFAILLFGASGSNVHGNRIFGGGYHMIGIGMVADAANDQAYDNFIHLRSGEPDHRFDEYGYQSSVHGFRQTWGGVNLSFHDNVVSVYAADGGFARGLWVVPNLGSSGLVFSDNILQAIFLNTDSTLYGPIALNGDGNLGVQPAVFQRNRIVSNLCNVYISSGYGYANNSRFYSNTFVKAGPSRGDYRTINIGYGSGSAVEHYFYDSTFEGGASYDSYVFSGYGTRNFYVGWTLTVQTEANATVTIRDAFGTIVYTGSSGGTGEVSIALLQYMQLPTSRTYYTDHEVTVEKSGFTTEIVDVTMDATKTVLIPLT